MNGERAKKRRKELRLSAESIAKALNTTRVTISRWEAGISEPDDKKKVALAKLLGTSVAYLMGETDDPNREADEKKADDSFNIMDIVSNLHATKTEPQGMAYWGGVVDNARGVALRQDESEIKEVSLMLKWALSLIETPEAEGNPEDKSSLLSAIPRVSAYNGSNSKYSGNVMNVGAVKSYTKKREAAAMG